jgi:hypothetical protein
VAVLKIPPLTTEEPPLADAESPLMVLNRPTTILPNRENLCSCPTTLAETYSHGVEIDRRDLASRVTIDSAG